MARSKSDIANSAIRIFLQEVGKFYDTERGLVPFGPKKAQKEELLNYFDYECCFCGVSIDAKSLSQDHLIPMNKEHLGLHAWGNVVPCCRPCNNEKNHHSWKIFIKLKCSGDELKSRINLIDSFVKDKGYDPNLDLHKYAGTLYQDVGEVAMTLIGLRLEQAKTAIHSIQKDRD